MTVQKRRETIKENGNCYNCLGTTHSREWCRSRNKCGVCNHNHHTMVHVDDHKASKPKPRTRPPRSEGSRRKSPSRNNRSKRPSSRNSPKQRHTKDRLENRSKTHVFLPTALAKVLTPDNPSKTRLLLNSGVATTVILEELTRRLHLKTTKRDGQIFCTINLMSYHDSSAKVQIYGVVKTGFNIPMPKST